MTHRLSREIVDVPSLVSFRAKLNGKLPESDRHVETESLQCLLPQAVDVRKTFCPLRVVNYE